MRDKIEEWHMLLISARQAGQDHVKIPLDDFMVHLEELEEEYDQDDD